MENINIESLTAKYGSPDLEIDKLKIWIHNWQFPESNEYWDSNWLNVTIFYQDNWSHVFDSGSYIHLPELDSFHNDLCKLDVTLKGKAILPTIEPILKIELEGMNLGHIQLKIVINPEGSSAKHVFENEIDQSYLKVIIKQLSGVFDKYSIRGKRE
jgi:hypothetical protein